MQETEVLHEELMVKEEELGSQFSTAFFSQMFFATNFEHGIEEASKLSQNDKDWIFS